MKFRIASDSILATSAADTRAGGSRVLQWAWLIWLVWLFWLFAPALFGSKDWPHWLGATVASMPVVAVLYIIAHACPRRHVIGYGLAIAAMAFAVTPFNPYAQTYIIYSCALAAVWGSPRRAFASIVVLLAAYSAEWLALGFPWEFLINALVVSLVVGGMIIFECVQREHRAELRLTHDEVRRLAASAERERIGRDLHDLLGHTLSLIALKSELAGRLFDRDARAARGEIAEVERVARDALAQVRSAVTGIRAAVLVSELASARLLLETAGTHMDYRRSAPDLPGNVETCLALVLREAVTNIERHARATRVEVTVDADEAVARMRIRDDGRGGVVTAGNGLAGMRERIDALGGSLAVDSPRGRGTTIEVALPLPTPTGRRSEQPANDVAPLPAAAANPAGSPA